ncbi:MAG: hypothetical protein JNK27_02325 [Chitinophagaceae bacterium]|nr:hypothetical protein [Chitinophagaceae bacterium]
MIIVINNKLKKNTLLFSLLGTAILLSLFTSITTPLLNSGDDAFMMYTLAGGFGEAPTNLLHYNHLWHPWIGSLVSNLFSVMPEVNWYSIVLLVYHWLGLTAVFYVMLRTIKLSSAVLLFLTLFIFIEARLLLSLNLTGAAFVSGSGAVLLLTYLVKQLRITNWLTVFAVLLLLLAGMLRLHVIVLVIFLFVPLLFFRFSKKQIAQVAIIFFLSGAILFGLNKLQEQYYTKHIPGWKKQEEFRQGLFYAYNRPIKENIPRDVFTDSTERELFFSAFLYDSVKFTPERVMDISKNITRERWLDEKEDRLGLYWFFIELRIYLLLFIVIIWLLFMNRQIKQLRYWLLPVLAVLFVHAYLFVFLKMTATIHLGLLFILWIQFSTTIQGGTTFFSGKKSAAFLISGILILLLAWMSVRLYKENMANKGRQQKFRCVMKELNQQKDKLFIATDDSFPLGYFYIWDVPAQYPVTNLLYKDRLLTHMYPQTLSRYGMKDLNKALSEDTRILLLGGRLPSLEKIVSGKKLSESIPAFKCMEVRRLDQIR